MRVVPVEIAEQTRNLLRLNPEIQSVLLFEFGDLHTAFHEDVSIELSKYNTKMHEICNSD